MNEKLSADDYCTLNVPKTTREAIKEIASKERFPPNWTVIANQLLLKGIDDYNNKNNACNCDNCSESLS